MFAAMFPSRTLTLYLARLFITRILGVLVMLVLILGESIYLGNRVKRLARERFNWDFEKRAFLAAVASALATREAPG